MADLDQHRRDGLRKPRKQLSTSLFFTVFAWTESVFCDIQIPVLRPPLYGLLPTSVLVYSDEVYRATLVKLVFEK